MSSRNRPLAVGSAAAMLVAFAATLFATRGLVDVIVMVVVVAALAGLYLLRRYARATLVYYPSLLGRTPPPTVRHHAVGRSGTRRRSRQEPLADSVIPAPFSSRTP